MPLKDHFHPPLSDVRHWESFHARWATVIADTLEADLLPPGYFAEVQVHVGRVEIDIAAFEAEMAEEPALPGKNGNGAATATLTQKAWAPPAPAMILPAEFPDRIEVLIFQSETGPTLVAAIEMVSPRNKDRPSSRRAFATKCANYLQHGVGLVVVDVVTNRKANLHDDLIRLMELGDEFLLGEESLYAVSYRPIQKNDKDEIHVWHEELSVGDELPEMPLPLDKGQCIRLDLESTYVETCRRMRLPNE